MATRISDDERQRIVDDLTAGHTVHATAERHGRSKATIGKIGREAGIDSGSVARARLARAHEARRSVGAESRAEVAVEARDKALALLAEMDADVEEVVAVAGVGAETVTRAAQPRDKHYRASAFRALWQSVMETVRFDERGEESLSEVDRWLADMKGEG